MMAEFCVKMKAHIQICTNIYTPFSFLKCKKVIIGLEQLHIPFCVVKHQSATIYYYPIVHRCLVPRANIPELDRHSVLQNTLHSSIPETFRNSLHSPSSSAGNGVSWNVIITVIPIPSPRQQAIILQEKIIDVLELQPSYP